MKKIFRFLVFLSVVIFCVVCSNSTKVNGLYLAGNGKWDNIPAKNKLIVIVHGWVEKGPGGWPEDMAEQITKIIDCNQWDCGYFDWSDGANKINPADAAKYARDTAGPSLANIILQRYENLDHIHLIGHSSGCWVISEASKILSEKTKADLHLTFLDAFIPPGWDEKSLGDIKKLYGQTVWIEQYYTRDYTLEFTGKDLSFAHNVDITAIDNGLKDHNFPWRWYYATICGRYPKSFFSDGKKYRCNINETEYGFARSREASGNIGWKKSISLAVGNEAVVGSVFVEE